VRLENSLEVTARPQRVWELLVDVPSVVPCMPGAELTQVVDHGGAGYVTEYGIERSSRDLQLDRIGAGRDEIILEVIGRSYGCEGGGPVMSGLCLGQNTPRLDHRA